jgi:hypothetical protein
VILLFLAAGALLGTIVGHFIRSARVKIAVALAAIGLPLGGGLLLYWAGSRSGCAGGECGGAIIALGMLGLLLAPLVIAGIVLLLQLPLDLAAGRASGPAGRWFRLLASPAPLAAGALLLVAARGAFTREPAASCTAAPHVALVNGEAFLFPVARDVVLRPADGAAAPYDFALKEDARRFCSGPGTDPPGSVAAASLEFFTGEPLSRYAADGWRTQVFGPAVNRLERPFCRSLAPPLVRAPFCARSGRPGEAERMGAPTRLALRPLASSEFALPLATLMSRDRIFTATHLKDAISGLAPGASEAGYAAWHGHGKWVLSRQAPGTAPEAVPERLAFCTANPNGWIACSARRRLSARSAALYDLRIPGASAPAEIVRVLDAMDAAVDAMRVAPRKS